MTDIKSNKIITVLGPDDMPVGVYQFIYLPCGSTAEFDYRAGHGYRCLSCNSVFGSVGMPQECRDEYEKYLLMDTLGGGRWDFGNGTFIEKQ